MLIAVSSSDSSLRSTALAHPHSLGVGSYATRCDEAWRSQRGDKAVSQPPAPASERVAATAGQSDPPRDEWRFARSIPRLATDAGFTPLMRGLGSVEVQLRKRPPSAQNFDELFGIVAERVATDEVGRKRMISVKLVKPIDGDRLDHFDVSQQVPGSGREERG